MANKSFGVKEINIVGSSGTPTIESPTNLNINANTVAISTDVSIGGQVTSSIIVGTGKSIGVGTTTPRYNVDVIGDIHFSGSLYQNGTLFSGGGGGAQGIQGATGTGSQGSQGVQGVQGSQGAQGIQGATGTGSQGAQGIQGATGTGSQGAQGIQGATGTGSQGSQGVQGSQGSQGAQGIQGATGTGSQGSQGIQGAQGPAGSGGGGESYWVSTSAGIHTLSNVGVGTTNPTDAITIGDSGDNPTGKGGRILFHGKDGNNSNISIGHGSNYRLVDDPNSSSPTGINNISIGANAGNFIETSDLNVSIGYNAHYSLSSKYGTALGSHAGELQYAGANNLHLGSFTGISQYGDYRIIIGSGYGDAYELGYRGYKFDAPDADNPLFNNVGKSYQLAIGIRTSTAPSKYWIVGNENFNIGIGTTAPQYKLDVAGDINFSGSLYQNGTLFSSGAQGSQGIQGTIGAQGSQGVQGSQGSQGAQGIQGSTGAQGAQGVQGSSGTSGSVGGVPYQFSTSLVDSDPGDGYIRYNNSVLGDVTSIFIDNVDYNLVPRVNWYSTWDDSTSSDKGVLIVSNSLGSIVHIWTVTSITLASGYYKINVSYNSGSTSFALNDTLIANFIRYGNIGSQGVQGSTGTSGAQGVQGATGPQGPGVGAQGIQGAQGPAGSGVGAALTISTRNGFAGINSTDAVSNVGAIRFDSNSGFNVTDLGSGEVFVDLGSTFNPWEVAGQDTLDAIGEEPVEFVAGSGIVITTNSTSTPKSITFAASGGGGSSVGTGITLGTPTDSSFADGLLSFTPTTTVTDAIDEVNEILNKLAPAKPQNLSAVTISLSSSYSATETSSGTSRSNVTSSTTPQTNTTSAFYDGDSGTLSAYIDGSLATNSSQVLTTSDDSGTYGSLIIASDVDTYSGQSGKEGFWKQLTARILSASSLATGSHTYQLRHSGTGDTNTLTFYVDDPVTTSITSTSSSFSGSTSSYISGVPTLSSGTTFTVSFTINDAIKQFYNTTQVATITGSSILSSSVSHSITGVQTPNATITVSGKTCTVGSSKYSETNSLTITPYNSAGNSGTTASISLGARVDTVSNESSRLLAGSGQYPTTGYGAGNTFTSSNSLKTVYTEELQLLNGVYCWPSANYSSNTPTAGPDYSSGMGSSDRWVIFQHGVSLSNISAFTFTIDGSSNFGSTAIVTGIKIYAKVEGVTGWIDCNAAYSPGTNPSSDGDAALVIANSTATSKRITFGTIARSGTLYIRIGLPAASNKTFSGVSITLG